MQQAKHAQAMADRFRELVQSAGDSLPDSHYDELKLIIESGLDAALIESMEGVATKLERMAREIKHDVESDN